MPPLGLQRLLTVPLILLIAPLASADAITGRVVDANGVGVAGVDIDFVNLGSGGNPHEQNDGTDANGNFVTTVDAGVYEIRFFPPPPPASTHLTGVLARVVVSGTKNLGTITLAHGVALQGTTRNAANQPVGGVRVDVFDDTTGARYPMKGNVTNAFGNFSVAVPANAPLRVEFLTSAVLGQVLVPRRLVTTITDSTNLGTIALQNGFHLTGTVHTQSGAAVVGANTDVTIPPSGDTLFTPSDNTNSLGVFDVVVPAGTYDLDVIRPTGLALVGVGLRDVVVSAATNVGVLTMRNGVFLSGTVRDRKNQVVLGADVNVLEVATGHSISLGNDNTNAAGFYSVVVPTGLLDVVFSPPGSRSPLKQDFHDGVDVTANATLDGQLPGAPASTTLAPHQPSIPGGTVVQPIGRGSAGRPGSAPFTVPFLQGSRSRAGLSVTLSGARPGASARLWLGTEEHARSSDPLLHLVQPRLEIPVLVDEHGSARFTLPAGALGTTTYAQFIVADPEAPMGFAVSHVLSLETTR